jgi:hypothetical protein
MGSHRSWERAKGRSSLPTPLLIAPLEISLIRKRPSTRLTASAAAVSTDNLGSYALRGQRTVSGSSGADFSRRGMAKRLKFQVPFRWPPAYTEDRVRRRGDLWEFRPC